MPPRQAVIMVLKIVKIHSWCTLFQCVSHGRWDSSWICCELLFGTLTACTCGSSTLAAVRGSSESDLVTSCMDEFCTSCDWRNEHAHKKALWMIFLFFWILRSQKCLPPFFCRSHTVLPACWRIHFQECQSVGSRGTVSCRILFFGKKEDSRGEFPPPWTTILFLFHYFVVSIPLFRCFYSTISSCINHLMLSLYSEDPSITLLAISHNSSHSLGGNHLLTPSYSFLLLLTPSAGTSWSESTKAPFSAYDCGHSKDYYSVDVFVTTCWILLFRVAPSRCWWFCNNTLCGNSSVHTGNFVHQVCFVATVELLSWTWERLYRWSFPFVPRSPSARRKDLPAYLANAFVPVSTLCSGKIVCVVSVVEVYEFSSHSFHLCWIPLFQFVE